ncbi:MAG: hypothetical protein KAI17_12630 [Thiotrichaceae bacterium]|nr:hypothetical protein [Thiotrichaceae bacterium]
MIPHSKDAVMKQHLEQWKASGTTQRAYCRQHNIQHHIFSYYKKKFKSQFSASTAVKNQLIPIEIITEKSLPHKITITHLNGFSLEVDSNTPLSELKPVLELLSSVT